MSTAIVTGAGRGIGSVIAETLAERGMDIAICFQSNEAAAQETAERCEKKGVRTYVQKADISRPEEVKDFVAQAKAQLGPAEVLVNNAGITRDTLLLSMKNEDLDLVIDTNLKGAILVTREVLRDMLKSRKGAVISISSVVGLHGNAGQTNYAAAKAGLIGFTKSGAREYGAKGIRFNAVAPGFIETEMTKDLPETVREACLKSIPLARFGTPRDVAETVAFLASDSASYINGQVISVDGGM